MSNPSMSPTYAEALTSFDQGYIAFLAAFAQAPDEALAYVPPGDEYALGVLPLHLQDPLRRYTALLRQMLRANFGEVDLSADPEREAREARWHAELVAQRPTGADRPGMLAGLAATHQEARAALVALDEATGARTAPVIYSAGSAPYPTSARNILGWLTDHYQEHITQTQAMLAEWRAQMRV